MARARKKPIPITIVAGARGTGKTTLINRLLKTPAFAGTAVVLNDFGKTALDGVSLAAIGDSYLSLGGGCICCAARGALSETLEGLLRDLDNGRVDPVSRVVVETDAAADPAAILGEVALHPYLSLRFVADGIVAVLAAPAVGDMLAGQADVVRQIAMADVVAVFGGALPALAAVNPRATIVDAATVDASALMGHGPFDPASGDIAAWLGPDVPPAATPLMGEAGRIATFTVARQRSLSLADADRFIEYLAYLHASNLDPPARRRRHARRRYGDPGGHRQLLPAAGDRRRFGRHGDHDPLRRHRARSRRRHFLRRPRRLPQRGQRRHSRPDRAHRQPARHSRLFGAARALGSPPQACCRKPAPAQTTSATA